MNKQQEQREQLIKQIDDNLILTTVEAIFLIKGCETIDDFKYELLDNDGWFDIHLGSYDKADHDDYWHGNGLCNYASDVLMHFKEKTVWVRALTITGNFSWLMALPADEEIYV